MLKEYLLIYLKVFLLAGGGAFVVTILVKYIARKWGIVDNPGERKIHYQPIPRLGGIAIYLGMAVSIVCLKWCGLAGRLLTPEFLVILLGGFITLSVGVIDDLRSLRGGVPTVPKLLILFAVTLICSQFGVVINFPFLPTWLEVIITLGWIVGVTSAFNAIDHMDGLASGLALIASIVYLGVAIQTGQWQWGILAAALMGANLGFLGHNFNPASIFMGDSGSFFLGFTLAAMSIMGGWSTNPIKASIIPVLVLGIPLFDLAYVIIKRQHEGITKSMKDIIVYSGADHIGHRLMKLGLNQKQTVFLIYMIALAGALGAFIIRNTSRIEAMVLLGQVLLTLIIIFILIGLKKKGN
jgi:UDP-GlcNAc:undecaprenyl-phosphate/decaprenyl-phosphate GlcNAc-1-phosphate transferase